MGHRNRKHALLLLVETIGKHPQRHREICLHLRNEIIFTAWPGADSRSCSSHGTISIGVPTSTRLQISSISLFFTAMQPSVQLNGRQA